MLQGLNASVPDWGSPAGIVPIKGLEPLAFLQVHGSDRTVRNVFKTLTLSQHMVQSHYMSQGGEHLNCLSWCSCFGFALAEAQHPAPSAA